MEPDQYLLRSLSVSDVARCAQIAGLSFESDRHTQLKARCPHNPYNHEDSMKGALRHWLQRPQGTVELTVAVETSSQLVVGWVAWGFRGFTLGQDGKKREEETKHPKSKIEPLKSASGSQPAADGKTTKLSDRERLERHTGADMAAWMERLMPPGTKFMFICSVAVDPSFQRKGIGSILLHHGTDRADAEAVFCWVHASEAGALLFEKYGFKEIGSLELDLDDWNTANIEAPEGSDARWGTYTFKYMQREPQKA